MLTDAVVILHPRGEHGSARGGGAGTRCHAERVQHGGHHAAHPPHGQGHLPSPPALRQETLSPPQDRWVLLLSTFAIVSQLADFSNFIFYVKSFCC